MTTEPGVTGAVRVRIAPSPTGPLHIGTARTAGEAVASLERHFDGEMARVRSAIGTRLSAATPAIVHRPHPMRADSTAWRITATLPVASKV